MNSKFTLKKFLSEFEIYLGAILFATMTVLLFVQVVSRYVLGHAITWTEELCTIFFVWMVYLGCASAVTRRKHICIDAFVSVVPFKVRKVLLIIDDLIFAAFSIYIIFPMATITKSYLAKNAVSSILRFPKALSFGMMPICFILIVIRIIPDIIRLWNEKEHELGKSVPTMDMEKLEAEAAAIKAEKAARKAAAQKGEEK